MPAINTNTAANSAVRYLNINSAQESSSLAKLSSGSRITSASDDAATRHLDPHLLGRHHAPAGRDQRLAGDRDPPDR